QAVTHIGKRTPDDHTHRVVEVRPLHLQLEVDLRHLVVGEVDLSTGDVVVVDRGVVGSGFVSHQFSILRSLSLSKGGCSGVADYSPDLDKLDQRCSICRGTARLWRSSG